MKLSSEAVDAIVGHAVEQVVAHIDLWVARGGHALAEADAKDIERILSMEFDRAVRYLEVPVA